MIKTEGAVNIHKRHLKDLIRNSEQELTLREAPARVSSNVNPLFGDSARETDTTGTERGPYKCLWYDALSSRSMGSTGVGFEQTIQRLAGQYRDATAFAELWLEDVLQDPADVSGPTWFDTSRDIVYQGKRFKFLGDVRLGLSTVAPYLLMVVLKGGAGYVD